MIINLIQLKMIINNSNIDNKTINYLITAIEHQNNNKC